MEDSTRNNILSRPLQGHELLGRFVKRAGASAAKKSRDHQNNTLSRVRLEREKYRAPAVTLDHQRPKVPTAPTASSIPRQRGLLSTTLPHLNKYSTSQNWNSMTLKQPGLTSLKCLRSGASLKDIEKLHEIELEK